MSARVCHITSAHSRYDVRIFRKQCVSLANSGYETYLLVNDEHDDEIKDNVRIISTKLQAENRIKRFWIANRKLRQKALDLGADIYHLHDPDLLPLGNKLKACGKKVVFDSHEDIPRQIRDKIWINFFLRKIIALLYEKYEASSLGRYDAVVSVTPHIVERLRLLNSNTYLITNYPVISLDGSIQKRNHNRIICFAGGISPQWNHDKIIEAISDIDSVKYILAGKLSKQYEKKLIALPGWNKVDYRGVVDFTHVKKIYEASSVGMALNYCTQLGGSGTLGNTKLFEYMEAGLPVVCTNYSLWEEIVKTYACGFVVDPHDVNAIRNAIETLLDNPQVALDMGSSGRDAVKEKYNWKTQEKKFLDLYSDLSGKCEA